MNTRPPLSPDTIRRLVAESLGRDRWDGKRVLLITPDLSRTCPNGLMLDAIHEAIGARVAKLDILVALGTHPPIDEGQLDRLFACAPGERKRRWPKVDFHNHAFDDPSALARLGTIPAADIRALSGGRFEMEVPVTIHRRALDCDALLVCGPVFPHEVVGFSGGNKYFFPGIAGREIIDFFHWLGAVITNAAVIGRPRTPVRDVLDRAAALIPVERRCLALVVEKGGLAGCFYGTPESAWAEAAALSAELHVRRMPRPFRTVLSCAPEMYDELWTGGKCMYKLEPVVADGGELIIYAPHIAKISDTHGAVIEQIGYHVRDYYLKQWEQFRHLPWGILAHSTHVKGAGSYENGVERPRVNVTLATGIPEATCRKINLGYRDPASIDPAAFAGRESEGVLLVPHAGEQLYLLEEPPA